MWNKQTKKNKKSKLGFLGKYLCMQLEAYVHRV